ncbi:unnamed protein product [Brachionus calyciflorus]|uniref:Uncharacterized protein n=1 Tax=Brachionus calyciflorus TaxID=104777 RepID=A0A814JGB1_9BILA|nr:unnamed protein product [Brachionus calyciflorus]
MAENSIKLEKNLKVINGISLLVGVIIGSGIFISPVGVIQECGSIGISLLAWVICGLISMFGAMSYAELGCMIPKAGGEYEYLMVAFGKLTGFLFIWTFIIVMIPSSFALSALTFADYALQPFYEGCSPPLAPRILLAAAAISILTLINCVSVKLTNYVQNLFNIGKIAGLLMIIGLGAYSLLNGRTENFHAPFENSKYDPGNIAVAFYAGMYSYSGWSFLNYVVEEMKNPIRVLPVSIFFGLGAVIVIYVFANIAYFTLLSPKEMIASSAVAFSFADKILGDYSWIMSIFVSLSSLGYINGALFSASRTIFGAARNSHMPSLLALINIKFLTPITSILFMGLASLLCLVIEDTFVLLKLTMLSEYIFIGGTVVGLLWLRRVKPDILRPIKVNLFFPIVFLFTCIFTIIMTFIKSPQDSLMCLFVILLGVPVYYIFVYIKKPKSIQSKIDAITIFTQIVTYSVFDDSKSD